MFKMCRNFILLLVVGITNSQVFFSIPTSTARLSIQNPFSFLGGIRNFVANEAATPPDLSQVENGHAGGHLQLSISNGYPQRNAATFRHETAESDRNLFRHETGKFSRNSFRHETAESTGNTYTTEASNEYERDFKNTMRGTADGSFRSRGLEASVHLTEGADTQKSALPMGLEVNVSPSLSKAFNAGKNAVRALLDELREDVPKRNLNKTVHGTISLAVVDNEKVTGQSHHSLGLEASEVHVLDSDTDSRKITQPTPFNIQVNGAIDIGKDTARSLIGAEVTTLIKAPEVILQGTTDAANFPIDGLSHAKTEVPTLIETPPVILQRTTDAESSLIDGFNHAKHLVTTVIKAPEVILRGTTDAASSVIGGFNNAQTEVKSPTVIVQGTINSEIPVYGTVTNLSVMEQSNRTEHSQRTHRFEASVVADPPKRTLPIKLEVNVNPISQVASGAKEAVGALIGGFQHAKHDVETELIKAPGAFLHGTIGLAKDTLSGAAGATINTAGTILDHAIWNVQHHLRPRPQGSPQPTTTVPEDAGGSSPQDADDSSPQLTEKPNQQTGDAEGTINISAYARIGPHVKKAVGKTYIVYSYWNRRVMEVTKPNRVVIAKATSYANKETQKFTAVSTGDGYFTIKPIAIPQLSMESVTNRMNVRFTSDVSDSGTANIHQLWKVNFIDKASGIVEISSALQNMCLEFWDDSENSVVVQRKCSGVVKQKWLLVPICY